MAENKKSFLLYTDVHHTVKKLTDEQAGKLFKHILSYVNDENPEINDLIIEIAFEPIKQSLKRDLEKYQAIIERNKINGSKGGRPKSSRSKPRKPSGLIGNPKNPSEPKKADSDNDSDNDNDKIIIDYNFIVDTYHSLCPKMKKVMVINDTRKGYMNARVDEFGLDKVISVLRMAGESNFLNGQSDDAWQADFEWILKPTNFVKVMEGKYENKITRKEPVFIPESDRLVPVENWQEPPRYKR